jgi:hypothetical protein
MFGSKWTIMHTMAPSINMRRRQTWERRMEVRHPAGTVTSSASACRFSCTLSAEHTRAVALMTSGRHGGTERRSGVARLRVRDWLRRISAMLKRLGSVGKLCHAYYLYIAHLPPSANPRRLLHNRMDQQDEEGPIFGRLGCNIPFHIYQDVHFVVAALRSVQCLVAELVLLQRFSHSATDNEWADAGNGKSAHSARLTVICCDCKR